MNWHLLPLLLPPKHIHAPNGGHNSSRKVVRFGKDRCRTSNRFAEVQRKRRAAAHLTSFRTSGRDTPKIEKSVRSYGSAAQLALAIAHTSHFINEKWNLNSCSLETTYFPEGELVAQGLTDSLAHRKLEEEKNGVYDWWYKYDEGPED